MPHFYAISIYRRKEYAAAGIPLLSVTKGIRTTQLHMVFYIVMFGIVSSLLFLTGVTGRVYMYIMLCLSLVWIMYAVRGLIMRDGIDKWARQMFFYSLVVNLVFSLLFITNFLLI